MYPGEWLKFLLKFVPVVQAVRLVFAVLLLKEEIFTCRKRFELPSGS